MFGVRRPSKAFPLPPPSDALRVTQARRRSTKRTELIEKYTDTTKGYTHVPDGRVLQPADAVSARRTLPQQNNAENNVEARKFKNSNRRVGFGGERVAVGVVGAVDVRVGAV